MRTFVFGRRKKNVNAHVLETRTWFVVYLNKRFDRSTFLENDKDEHAGQRHQKRERMLTIGQSRDVYEQEADPVSEQVMSMPETQSTAPMRLRRSVCQVSD